MKNILAIGAHPDDVEFGCFGTLKRHVLEGDNVTICLMSNSTVKDAVTGNFTRTETESISEAQTAAQSIGAELIMLDYQDTEVPFNSDSVKKVERILADKKIDIVYTHWAGDTHQDHVNTLNTTLAASRMVSNVLCYEQVPLPRVCTTYPVANYYVDITSVINDKIQGCLCHTSQITKYKKMGINITDNLKTLAKFRGTQCNVKYAEAFNILKIVKK